MSYAFELCCTSVSLSASQRNVWCKSYTSCHALRQLGAPLSARKLSPTNSLQGPVEYRRPATQHPLLDCEGYSGRYHFSSTFNGTSHLRPHLTGSRDYQAQLKVNQGSYGQPQGFPSHENSIHRSMGTCSPELSDYNGELGRLSLTRSPKLCIHDIVHSKAVCV